MRYARGFVAAVAMSTAIGAGTALARQVEKTSQELHGFSEGGSAISAASGGHATVNGSRNGSFSGSASTYGAARGASVEDSQVSTETIDDARVSVRLVDQNGDILWTSTQESQGAKYKGASADAADKIAKQLMREIARLEHEPVSH